MASRLELTGQKFGRLTVLEFAGIRSKQSFWSCICDCGNNYVVKGCRLTAKEIVSCGCFRRENASKKLKGQISPRRKDLTGQTFNALTVTSLSEVKNGVVYWNCICRCGNTTTVRAAKLKNESTKSCGCYKEWIKSEIGKRSFIHGKSSSRTFDIWSNMKARCLNEEDPDYGGRSIKVCSRWANSFSDFLEDMNEAPENLSIDRIDVNGNYSCGHCKECLEMGWTANCRWADRKQQSRNTRVNRLIEHDGQVKCLAEWAEEYGIAYHVLHKRLKRGWDMHLALTLPPGSRL